MSTAIGENLTLRQIRSAMRPATQNSGSLNKLDKLSNRLLWQTVMSGMTSVLIAVTPPTQHQRTQ